TLCARLRFVFLSRADRPSFIGRSLVAGARFRFSYLRPLSIERVGAAISRRGNQVAASDDHLVNRSLNPILGRELSLLDGSFDEQVVALLICGCDVGQLVIEDQAMPIRLGDELVLFVTVTVILRKAGVRNFGS